jgi:hypothetical protein
MTREIVQRPYAAVTQMFEPFSRIHKIDTQCMTVTAGYDKDPVYEELMGINVFDYDKSGIPKT